MISKLQQAALYLGVGVTGVAIYDILLDISLNNQYMRICTK